MSEKTLKFGDVENNNKNYATFKLLITLNLVAIDKIVISDKFKHSNKDFKCFIGYKENNIIGPLTIILPQMSGFAKYFDYGGNNLSLKIENDNMLVKYIQIWNKIKTILSTKFHSEVFMMEDT